MTPQNANLNASFLSHILLLINQDANVDLSKVCSKYLEYSNSENPTIESAPKKEFSTPKNVYSHSSNIKFNNVSQNGQEKQGNAESTQQIDAAVPKQSFNVRSPTENTKKRPLESDGDAQARKQFVSEPKESLSGKQTIKAPTTFKPSTTIELKKMDTTQKSTAGVFVVGQSSIKLPEHKTPQSTPNKPIVKESSSFTDNQTNPIIFGQSKPQSSTNQNSNKFDITNTTEKTQTSNPFNLPTNPIDSKSQEAKPFSFNLPKNAMQSNSLQNNTFTFKLPNNNQNEQKATAFSFQQANPTMEKTNPFQSASNPSNPPNSTANPFQQAQKPAEPFQPSQNTMKTAPTSNTFTFSTNTFQNTNPAPNTTNVQQPSNASNPFKPANNTIQSGQSSQSADKTTGFKFGATSEVNPSPFQQNSFSKPNTNYGSSAAIPTATQEQPKPAFSFNQPFVPTTKEADTKNTKNPFNFGQTTSQMNPQKTESPAPKFTFNSANTEIAAAPTFSFNQNSQDSGIVHSQPKEEEEVEEFTPEMQQQETTSYKGEGEQHDKELVAINAQVYMMGDDNAYIGQGKGLLRICSSPVDLKMPTGERYYRVLYRPLGQKNLILNMRIIKGTQISGTTEKGKKKTLKILTFSYLGGDKPRIVRARTSEEDGELFLKEFEKHNK